MPITMFTPKGVMLLSLDVLTCMGYEKIERIKSKPKSASMTCGIASGFESNDFKSCLFSCPATMSLGVLMMGAATENHHFSRLDSL